MFCCHVANWSLCCRCFCNGLECRLYETFMVEHVFAINGTTCSQHLFGPEWIKSASSEQSFFSWIRSVIQTKLMHEAGIQFQRAINHRMIRHKSTFYGVTSGIIDTDFCQSTKTRKAARKANRSRKRAAALVDVVLWTRRGRRASTQPCLWEWFALAADSIHQYSSEVAVCFSSALLTNPNVVFVVKLRIMRCVYKDWM